MASPATPWFDIHQLESKYGLKIKADIRQMERNAALAKKGVCFALTEKWFQTGLEEEKVVTREDRARAKFRQEIGDTLAGGTFPQGIVKRQEKLAKDKPIEFKKQLKKMEFQSVSPSAFAKVSTIAHTNISPVQHTFIASGWFQCPDSDADEAEKAAWKVKWADKLANLLKTHGDPNSSAYFCLEVKRDARPEEQRGVEQHVIGLKRGKPKTGSPRHYSLFDPNHFEITQIKENDLPKFLVDISPLLPEFDYGYLAEVKNGFGVVINEW